MTQFRGQLFRGRLFAGRLFRGPQEAPQPVFPGGPGVLQRRQKPRRRDRDDDVLLFLLR